MKRYMKYITCNDDRDYRGTARGEDGYRGKPGDRVIDLNTKLKGTVKRVSSEGYMEVEWDIPDSIVWNRSTIKFI